MPDIDNAGNEVQVVLFKFINEMVSTLKAEGAANHGIISLEMMITSIIQSYMVGYAHGREVSVWSQDDEVIR